VLGLGVFGIGLANRPGDLLGILQVAGLDRTLASSGQHRNVPFEFFEGLVQQFGSRDSHRQTIIALGHRPQPGEVGIATLAGRGLHGPLKGLATHRRGDLHRVGGFAASQQDRIAIGPEWRALLRKNAVDRRGDSEALRIENRSSRGLGEPTAEFGRSNLGVVNQLIEHQHAAGVLGQDTQQAVVDAGTDCIRMHRDLPVTQLGHQPAHLFGLHDAGGAHPIADVNDRTGPVTREGLQGRFESRPQIGRPERDPLVELRQSGIHFGRLRLGERRLQSLEGTVDGIQPNPVGRRKGGEQFPHHSHRLTAVLPHL